MTKIEITEILDQIGQTILFQQRVFSNGYRVCFWYTLAPWNTIFYIHRVDRLGQFPWPKITFAIQKLRTINWLQCGKVHFKNSKFLAMADKASEILFVWQLTTLMVENHHISHWMCRIAPVCWTYINHKMKSRA